METKEKTYVVSLANVDCIDNFGNLRFSIEKPVNIIKSVDGIPTEFETNKLSIGGSAFIAQFASKSIGHKGVVSYLAQKKELKSQNVLGLCNSFEISIKNVSEEDTYINADGVENHYGGKGTIITVEKFNLNSFGIKQISFYNNHNVFVESARKAFED